MVNGKTKYIQLVHGNRTRVCFDNGPIRITLSKKTPCKGEEEGQVAKIYPNYPVINQKIILEDRLPQDHSFNEGEINLQFTSICALSSDQNKLDRLNELSKYVVQIHFIQSSRRHYHLYSGTGVLIKNEDRYQILTCLHTLIPTNDKIDNHIIITNAEENMNGLIDSQLGLYQQAPRILILIHCWTFFE